MTKSMINKAIDLEDLVSANMKKASAILAAMRTLQSNTTFMRAAASSYGTCGSASLGRWRIAVQPCHPGDLDRRRTPLAADAGFVRA